MAAPRLLKIRASAGSGKTWQLTKNYLEHLARIDSRAGSADYAALASRILAITFTNAAANEMRQRVIQRLKKAALKQETNLMEPETARLWLQIFLTDLSALNIRTIDSLLHQITRASALDLGINPDYEIEFDIEEILDPFLDLLREEAAGDGPARELFFNACKSLLEGDGSTSFSSRDKLRDKLKEVLENTIAGKFDALASAEQIGEAREKLVAEVIGLAKEFRMIAGTSWTKIDARARKVLNKAENGELEPNSAYWKRDAQGLYNKDGVAPPGLDMVFNQLRKAVVANHHCIELLNGASNWLPFMDIAHTVANSFRQNQHLSRQLPQALVPTLAKSVLNPVEMVTDALCRLGTRLMHYLVDEFQDTSDEQWLVLHGLVHEAISKGGSMIWVGDPKQSIYGFRGGNPQLFDLAGEDPVLRAIVPDMIPQHLETNRRSLEEIVHFNNEIFEPLGTVKGAAKLLGAILSKNTPPLVIQSGAERIAEVYRDVHQEPCEHPGAVSPGFVSLEKTEGKNAADQKVFRLNRLCDLIQNEIRPRHSLADILILVRSNWQAKEIAARLAELEIPAITENGLVLQDNALIKQTIQFLSFLDTPTNDQAFFGFMTGNIVAEYPGLQAIETVDWPRLAADSQPLYQAFINHYPDIWKVVVAPFFNDPALLAPYDVVREWYDHLHVFERFGEDTTMLRRFLEILHLGESMCLTSIRSFLDYWAEEGSGERAPMPENMEAIRIMTIHKAKGLQGRVVVIPDVNFKIEAPSHPVSMQVEGLHVAPKLSANMGPFYSEEMAKQALEAINLLYVAMTRAEEELYIFLADPTSNHSSLAKGIRELFGKSDEELPYERGKRTGSMQDTQTSRESGPSPRLPTLAEDWRPMQWLPGLRIYRTHTRQPVLTANERGIFVHAALEALTPHLPVEEAVALALAYAEKATGLVPPDREELRRRLVWFATLPDAKTWLTKGQAEHSMLAEDGKLQRPDLVVPMEAGPLVIDYKTGSHVTDGHVDQVRRYLRILGDSGQYPGKPIGLLIYLDLEKFRLVTLEHASEPVSDLPL